MIQSIAVRTFRSDQPVADSLATFLQRLGALSHSLDQLNQDGVMTASLRRIVEAETDSFRDRVAIRGPEVMLKGQAAQNFGLTVHELLTNAVKYGALSAPGGRVEIEWTTEPAASGSTFRFRWVETGGPAVTPPSRRGFGTTLIGRAFGADQSILARLEFPAQGVTFTLEIPLASIEAREVEWLKPAARYRGA